MLSIFGSGKEGFSVKGLFGEEKLDFRVLHNVSSPRRTVKIFTRKLVLHLGVGKVRLSIGVHLGEGRLRLCVPAMVRGLCLWPVLGRSHGLFCDYCGLLQGPLCDCLSVPLLD